MAEFQYAADKFVFRVKKDLLYSRNDVWIKPETDGTMRIGLTDFAQRRSGDIVFAEVSPAGTELERGGLLGSYETVKIVQDILSPVDGQIIEVNQAIGSMPEIINRDPYGEGWVAVLKPESGSEGLLKAEDYFELMKVRVVEELKKIKGL